MPRLTRDGVALGYEETGGGAPPLLLVHPFGGNRAFMAPQAEYFGRRHRVVAVDLRGHGQSDTPPQNYTIAGFADDLAWLCRELAISKPVVVGHSMGGMCALELAARAPALPAAVVLLDAPVVTPEGLLDGFRPYAEALRSPAYREATRQFYAHFVGFPDRPEPRERLLDELSSNVQQVLVSALDGVLTYDSQKAAAACTVPVLYVSSGPWYTDVARFRELCPQLVTGQAVGSGHFLQLEVPEQVNPMIARFLAITLGPDDSEATTASPQ